MKITEANSVGKFLVGFFAVFALGTGVFAQQGKILTDEHASIGDQQACYRQARQFLTDTNKDPETLTPWNFNRAHFEPKVRVCYLSYWRDMPSPFPDVSVHEDSVADAFEGRVVTLFIEQLNLSTSKGVIQFCRVGTVRCHSQNEYDDLLWRLVPAFRPVTPEVGESRKR